jgi:hypothetical protein
VRRPEDTYSKTGCGARIATNGSSAPWKARREAIRTADRKAMGIARSQWGVLTHAQAISAGLTADQISYRLQTGQWKSVARNVYIVVGAPDRWEQKAMIACLAGPRGTVASHLTAAALFGLAKPPSIPHVTIKPAASGRFRGARPFRRQVEPGEVCVRSRIRCTTPVRTIIDCAAAGLLEADALCDLVDSALWKKIVRPTRLVAASGRAWTQARGRRRGRLAALERALDVWRSGAPAGSPPEAMLQRRLIEWGFPLAERQIEVYDEDGRFVARADVGIRELKVLFEYDSDEHHGPRCWIADDERKRRLEALGWIVVSVDRFDLRPSSTRLRTELERIRRSRLNVTITVKRDRDSGDRRSAA